MTAYMPEAKSIEWGTPQDLFDKLNKEHKFDIDACATEKNTKCDLYWDKEIDALKQDWSEFKCVFMNPPYGRGLEKWISKALKATEYRTKTVALLPARTDTRWFHDYIYEQPFVNTVFLKGRLKYGGCKTSAPFPSMIVTFNTFY